MRKTSILTTLLIVLFGACNKDKAIDPTDPLYRTWRWTQTETNDGRIVNHATTEFRIITFRPNGTILYGADGRYAPYCFPERFRRKGDTLSFANVESIPIPAVDNGEKCRLIDCAGYDALWQISALDDEQLVLKTSSENYVFQPYP